MSQGPSWLQVAVAAGIALVSAGLFIRRWSKARHILDTPTSRIRSAAQGYVELCGVLGASEGVSLQGPLTGRPCVWWHYRIEEYRRSGRSSQWHLLESGRSKQWLQLLDGTGECQVDPEGAEVVTGHRTVWTGSVRHPRRIARSSGWLGLLGVGSRYRYTEERLHAGDPLYAIGDFHSTGEGREAFRLADARGAVIRAWKQDFPALLQRFDQDGNGVLDALEWQRVQHAAEQQAQQRHRVASCTPAQHRLARPAEGQPFVLSTRSQEELARRFYWEAIGAAIVCLVSAVFFAVEIQALG